MPNHIASDVSENRPSRQDHNSWPQRVRRVEASRYLAEVHGVQTAPATLAKLACVGGGPRYELWGRTPYYPTNGLDDWAAVRLSPRRSTSGRGGVQ
jgi:hypothetical protein